MMEEKKEMQSVTIRIPKKLYADYKQALLEQGKIVTYDLRRYMSDVVEESARKETEQKK
ncbi:transcriptional regulator [Enterococcus faecium]|nr:transcriptional regulator [Enterococcus faecium]MBG0422752.1 transcriptional regulator [Enterococcus faecium]MBJ0921092.1 transcriptional regulator [Enterococcus faecium]TAP46282.1 transcriptional regulator [Enterococcus faecium]TAQ29372.1 transcriptional regulator [Enterococcus faecium]